MSNEKKFVVGVVVGSVALLLGAVFLLGGSGSSGSVLGGKAAVAPEILVRSDSWAQGPAETPVTVVEFSDFQCPACKAAEPTIKTVIAKYSDKIRFVYRHFPLSSHQYAFPAAQAAEAAGKQGKFWEMHDLLFAKQPEFQTDKLKNYAQSLGLDMERFNRDFDSDEIRQKILNDQSDGNKANVTATPTFFINGTKFTGVLTVAEFEKEIEERLK